MCRHTFGLISRRVQHEVRQDFEGFMISFTVRLRFHDKDIRQVREMLEALTLASRREPGCVLYVPHFVEGEPSTVFLYEQYRDEEAATAHRATDHFRQFAVAGLYQLMLERTVENLLAIC